MAVDWIAATLLSRVLLRARRALATCSITAGQPRQVAAAASLLLLIALPTQFAVAAPMVQPFHIEAGDAAQTLNEFSRQANLQLLFDYNVVRGRKTRAISGELPADTALREMLSDTGLMFDFVNDRTLAVTLNSRPSAAGTAIAGAATSAGRRSAAAETQSVSHDGAGTGDITADPRAPRLEEIRVLGTHLRGEEPLGAYLLHLDHEEIQDSPAGSIRDLLQSIPQVWGGGPSEDTHFFSSETTSNSAWGAGINLRGLGAGATLVLIDGRRMAPSGTEAAFTDIEAIPSSAVERIDILPDGASALYGSDAVGGVVNFTMRDNFTGSETLVRRGSGTQDTLEEYRVSQTMGTRWDSGNGMVSVEFYKRGDLPASARRYTNSNLTSLGGSDFDVPTTNPGNILAGSQTYAVPRGQNGAQLTVGDLTADTTPNTQNKYQDAEILPSQKRWTLYASGKQSLNDTFSLFGTALASRREAEIQTGGVMANLVIPNTNPFAANLKSLGPILVAYDFLDDIGPAATDVVANDLNLTLGVDIKLGSAWTMTLSGNYSQDRENQLQTGLIDLGRVEAALADPDPQTALNVFGDGSHTNPDTLKDIATNTHYHSNSKLGTLGVAADGPIAQLPGGAVELALGLDRRGQTFTSTSSATSITPAADTSGSRRVTGVYSELKIPVFGKDNGMIGLRKLEFSVTGRYEDYSDFGNAATPKLATAWSPIEALAVRATWGRSIRAPDVASLDTRNNHLAFTVLPDGSVPGGVTRVLVQTGNSPNLRSEHADIWTAGADFDASVLTRGLSFGSTYFNIRYRDRIQLETATAQLLNDPSFTDLIVRSPSAAAVTQVCSTGGIYASQVPGQSCTQSAPGAIVDLRTQNLASLRTSGVDLNMLYERRWTPGTLRVRLDGTYLLDFSQQVTPTSPLARLLNTQNNPIDLKLRGLLTWQQLHWGATLGINFQNHYRDVTSTPVRPISAYTTFDAQVRYAPPTFGHSALENTSIDFNAINLFNSSPPFLNNATAGLGYDQENADPTGRLISIQVRKSW